MKKILPLCLFLTSCAAIHTPATRMISPESNGGFLKGSADIRLAAVKRERIEFRGNDPKKPFSDDDSAYRLGGLLDLGLLDRLDFLYLGHMSTSSVGVYGAKVQILGKNRQDSKRGNFSLSLAGGAGSTDIDYDDSDNDVTGWVTNVEKLSANIDHHEAGLILGYRSHDRLLHYANAFYFHERLRGNVTTEGTGLVDEKFKDNQDGMIYSTGIIYNLGTRWLLKADFSHMVSKWSSFRSTTTNSMNAAIGFSW